MTKSKLHLKLFLLSVLVLLTLINLSYTSWPPDPGQCNTWSRWCYNWMMDKCNDLCIEHNGCSDVVFYWGWCYSGLCEQCWVYWCNDNSGDEYTCYAPDKYCPWK